MVTSLIQALLDQAQEYEDRGEIAQSWQLIRQALEQARQALDRQGQARALMQFARIEYLQGHAAESSAHAQEALEVADPETPEVVRAWMILGNCALLENAFEKAEDLYRKALDYARRFGTPVQRMVCLHNLANGIYLLRGQFDLAFSYESEAFRLAQQYDLKEKIFLSRIALNRIYLATGRFEAARAAIAEWHACEPISEVDFGYRCLLAAWLSLADGEVQHAADLFQQSLSRAEMYGEPGWLADVFLGMSQCRRRLGDRAGALDWADQALKIAQKNNFLETMGLTYIERARIAWNDADCSAAQSALQSALENLERAGSACEQARAALLLAALLSQSSSTQADSVFLDAGRRILAGNYLFLLDLERPLALPLLARQLNHHNEEIALLARKLLEALTHFPPAPLRVRTLGRLSLRVGTRKLDRNDLRSRRAGELLALLLSSPGYSLDAEQVSEALAPESDPEAGKAVVYKASAELRRILEPELPDRRFASRYIETGEGRLALRLPPDSWLDFQAFQAAVKQGDWEQAVDLYGGEFLPEYCFAEWTAWLRESLAQDFQTALLRLAEQRRAASQWSQALEFARRLLALDPWNEPAALVAMQAYQALGNPSAARRLYHRLEKVLQEELNLQPGEELRQFLRSL